MSYFSNCSPITKITFKRTYNKAFQKNEIIKPSLISKVINNGLQIKATFNNQRKINILEINYGSKSMEIEMQPDPKNRKTIFETEICIERITEEMVKSYFKYLGMNEEFAKRVYRTFYLEYLKSNQNNEMRDY